MKPTKTTDSSGHFRLDDATKRFIFFASVMAGLVLAAILFALRLSGLLSAEDFPLALIVYEVVLAAIVFPFLQIGMLNAASRFVPATRRSDKC